MAYLLMKNTGVRTSVGCGIRETYEEIEELAREHDGGAHIYEICKEDPRVSAFGQQTVAEMQKLVEQNILYYLGFVPSSE